MSARQPVDPTRRTSGPVDRTRQTSGPVDRTRRTSGPVDRTRQTSGPVVRLLATVLGVACAASVAHAQPALDPELSEAPEVPDPEAPEAPDPEAPEVPDPEAPDAADGPWMDSASADDQRVARALFWAGNELLFDAFPDEAIAKYREALAVWDHPAFHYNLAMAQRELAQLVAAHASLEQAMRHGVAPLGQRKYDHARRIQTRLESQLGRVDLACADPRATIQLDGVAVPLRPDGSRHRWVMPGPHQIVASRPDRVPDVRTVDLAPGARETVRCRLRAEGQVVLERRWWRGWPYIVAGGAAIVVAAGVPFDRDSSRAFREFDQRYLDVCPRGCTNRELPPEALRDLEDARGRQRVARALYAVGAAGACAAAVLLYLNRERAVSVPPATDADDPDVAVAPHLIPGGAGVAASFRF